MLLSGLRRHQGPATVAITGIGALVWQFAMQRRREFAIRLAVGASGTRLVLDVLAGALRLSSLGFAAGLCLYWLSSSWLATRLFGIGALDGPVIAQVLGPLLIATCVAALLPAVRAVFRECKVANRNRWATACQILAR
jgi:putative ABC transport system permease protein